MGGDGDYVEMLVIMAMNGETGDENDGDDGWYTVFYCCAASNHRTKRYNTAAVPATKPRSTTSRNIFT